MAMPLEHPHALNPFYIEEDDQDPDHPWEGPQMIMHGGQPYDVHAPFYTEGDEPDPDYPWEDKYVINLFFSDMKDEITDLKRY